MRVIRASQDTSSAHVHRPRSEATWIPRGTRQRVFSPAVNRNSRAQPGQKNRTAAAGTNLCQAGAAGGRSRPAAAQREPPKAVPATGQRPQDRGAVVPVRLRDGLPAQPVGRGIIRRQQLPPGVRRRRHHVAGVAGLRRNQHSSRAENTAYLLTPAARRGTSQMCDSQRCALCITNSGPTRTVPGVWLR